MDRIEIDNLELADNGDITGQIFLDGDSVGFFYDIKQSGEFYLEFIMKADEELFYELTDNYKGLKELQQETLISDLLKRDYDLSTR